MEDVNCFMEKAVIPTETALESFLGDKLKLWKSIQQFVLEAYPDGRAEWNFPGRKFGWSFRIKDKKRAIIYMLPRIGFFKVAFVFGQKATDTVMESDVSEHIKIELGNEVPFVEGRGISLDVLNDLDLVDIKKLIHIKLKH